ncbi:MAG: hypothetical protein HN742_12955 [Lentisphaerae bacterium]|nr:hypothetical protein [Lentisphaerota bacterium]MBT7054932.1 hypothetical protein [Lentisphaerota bacterium]MBT7842779.1 hypothetical protein [Lentisphaerota bacterium]
MASTHFVMALAPEGGGATAKDSQRLLCGQTYEVAVPVCPPEAAQVFLSFEARIEAGRFRSGSAPACVIAVNGIPTSLERLRNKARYYSFNAEHRVFWFAPSRSAWIFSYYPWGDTTKAGGHANRFVLDITDLLTAGPNAVTFTSIYLYGKNDKPLELRHVQFFTTDEFSKSPNLGQVAPARESQGLQRFRARARGRHAGALARLNTSIAYKPVIPPITPRRTHDQPYSATLRPDGSVRLIVGEDTYTISSSLRFTGAPWRDIGHGVGPGDWERFHVGKMAISAETEAVGWERSVLSRGSHLEFRDTFTNRTDRDQPVTLVNMVDCGTVDRIAEFRISGQLQEHFYACTSSTESRMTAVTPVCYVGLQRSAVGVVLEDDAYRNQATWMTWDAVLAAGTDMLYLEPFSTYELVWKVFPLQRPGYYDLLNAVRRSWDLYQEIPGLFGFVHPWSKERMYEDVRCNTDLERVDFLERTGIQVAASTFLYPGTEGKSRMLFGGEPIETHREAAPSFTAWRDMIRRHGTTTPCLPYLNIHLSRLTDGETLDGLAQRFPGAIPLNPWGEPVAYRQGWLYCILPQVGNPVGQHLNQLLELYLDELEFDGIYLDEWDHSRARLSYGHADGVSALLDTDGKMVRKVGFVPILSRDFQVEFATRIARRGLTLFANQFDATLTAAQLPIVHFAEPVDYGSYLLSAAQLGRTPLSLHLKPRASLFSTVREFLKRGVLTCHYWYYLHGEHVLKHCFPITVREVHPGAVVGMDRIITCASGRFSLGTRNPLKATIFAAPDGLLENTIHSGARDAEGNAVIDLSLSEEHVAVITEK